MQKSAKTHIVMISCITFSCGREYIVLPIRLAGTCRQYSKNATHQLSAIATTRGLDRRSLRCPYQAYVINTLEPTNITIGRRLRILILFPGCFFEAYVTKSHFSAEPLLNS